MTDTNESAFSELIGHTESKHGLCEDCGTPAVFLLKSGQDEYHVDIFTILKCVKIASEHGLVPEVPTEWWTEISRNFGDNVK